MSDPEIRVCTTCRRGELHRAAAKLAAIPPEEWPLSVEELLREHRLVLEYLRAERVPGAGVEADPVADRP